MPGGHCIPLAILDMLLISKRSAVSPFKLVPVGAPDLLLFPLR